MHVLAPTTNWSRIRTRRAEQSSHARNSALQTRTRTRWRACTQRVHGTYTLLNARISSVHFHVQLSAFTSLSLGKHYRTRELGSSSVPPPWNEQSTSTARHSARSGDRSWCEGEKFSDFTLLATSRNRLFSLARDRCACTRSLLHARATRARLWEFCLKECRHDI